MNWIIIILSIALLIWVLYQEWLRPNKKWLAARVLASVIAIGSLVCIALPVHYRSKISVIENEAVLLTEGWNKDSVNAFLGSHKKIPVFTNGETDLHLLNKQLHVFGYGLNEYDLQALKQKPYQFHPTPLQNAIQKISWNESVPLGRSLQVQGSYINASNKDIKLILSAFSVLLDSATVPPQQTASFQLNTVPKQIGKAVFTLSVIQGRDTLENNPVPVDVTFPQPLRLLMLSSAPDFEKKFLKNWLSQNGFTLAIKTKLTSGKWDQEFINRSPISLSSITTSLLKEFDIVVADVNALASLSPAESSALQQSINSSGTGLLVQMDSTLHSNAFYSQPFSLTVTQDSLAHSLQLSLPGENSMLPLSIESPVFIKPNENLQTNIQDQQGRILAATSLYGAGRVSATTINNTFVWQLSGQSPRYDLYWSHLLTAVAPQSNQHKSWRLNTSLPRKNEPVAIRFQNTGALPSLQVGETILYPAQDYFLPGEWNTTFWPRKAGWHPVLQNGEAAGWFYVYEPNDWAGVQKAERIRKTKLATDNHEPATVHQANEIRETKEIDPLYFFILFIASAGFLWYEKKRHRT